MNENMKGRKLLILGAGQYGNVVRETAEAIGCFSAIAFLDDKNPIAIGRLSDYRTYRNEFDCAFVAMGNPQLRKQWLNLLEREGFDLPVLVHPRAYVSPSAVLGKATIVEPLVVVNPQVTVEMGALLCVGCVLNHNSHILPVCQIDCNAVVASNAVVPEGTKVPSCTVYERK